MFRFSIIASLLVLGVAAQGLTEGILRTETKRSEGLVLGNVHQLNAKEKALLSIIREEEEEPMRRMSREMNRCMKKIDAVREEKGCKPCRCPPRRRGPRPTGPRGPRPTSSRDPRPTSSRDPRPTGSRDSRPTGPRDSRPTGHRGTRPSYAPDDEDDDE